MLLSDIRIRSACSDDMAAIVRLFARARASMKELGIDQWQDGYPFVSDIENDIGADAAYVLLKDGSVLGYFAFYSGREEAYEEITEGSFRETGKYSFVHRVAVDAEFRGLGFGKKMFEYAKKLAYIDLSVSLRCDTHEDNRPMRSLLMKCGFQRCGIVYYDKKSGNPKRRVAYDLLL